MPSYISHAIMGLEVYNEINRVNGFNTLIDANDMKGYSLGNDPCFISKRLINDPQNFGTRDFFCYMINYIKTNKLQDNSRVMALLYGHMVHYFFDINTHPLIYYVECGCKRSGLISNHDFVEGYLSSYLAKKILGVDIMDVKADFFNGVSFDDIEIAKMLSNAYGNIYGDYEIIRCYKKMMGLFSFLERIIKSGIISSELLSKVSGFNHFLEINGLSRDEIINNSKGFFRNPVTGDIYNDSFMELYYRAISMSIDAIEIVNKYLYDGYSSDVLLDIFKDLSYDTGMDCSLGNKFVYVRSKGRRVV